jgi:hypothetical protein
MPGKWVTGVAALLFCTALAAAPAASADKKHADLVLKSVDSPNEAPYYLFSTDDRLAFNIVVKNVGERATRAEGKLRISDPAIGPTAFHSVRFSMPTIRPGKTRWEQVLVRSRYLLGIGRYRDRACVASIRDPNQRNNCRKGPAFVEIPRRWTGIVKSTYPIIGSAVEESVADVSFVFEASRDTGFLYRGAGSLAYSASGSSSACTYSGSGSFPVDPNFALLDLRPDLAAYYATGFAPNQPYTISLDCGMAGNYQEPGPKNPAWWTIPEKAWGPNKKKITDSYSDPFGVTWTWDLQESLGP